MGREGGEKANSSPHEFVVVTACFMIAIADGTGHSAVR